MDLRLQRRSVRRLQISKWWLLQILLRSLFWGWTAWPLSNSTSVNERPSESKSMNNQFDELTKGMAQSVTRRQALKKFGVGLAGIALACFGLVNNVQAEKGGCKPVGAKCKLNSHCCSGFCYHPLYYSSFGICR